MANRPRTFEEVVAAQDPVERERWARAKHYRDPAVAQNVLHRTNARAPKAERFKKIPGASRG